MDEHISTQRTCLVCTEPLQTKVGSLYCCPSHRSLASKWRIKYNLTEEQIQERFKSIRLKESPHQSKDFIKHTPNQTKPKPPVILDQGKGKPVFNDEIIERLKELIKVVEISTVDLVPGEWIQSKYSIGRTTLFDWKRKGYIKSYSQSDKSKTYYDNNEIKRFLMGLK